MRLFSDPSVGSSPGTFPPNLNGDLWWRTLPGDQILAHAGSLGNVMEIDGYFEGVYDTDWSTPPWFHDRLEGPALASLTNPGNLEPAFLQLGLTSEVLVSMGPSGLPDPCDFVKFCEGGCPGGVSGYTVDIRFDGPPGSGVILPADGTAASHHATTWLLPGDMPYLSAPGSCGIGDYVFSDVRSPGETQADDLGGISAFSGSQLAGGGPVADPVDEMGETYPTFRDRVLNVLADTGLGLGMERSFNAGGATNALKLSVSSGAARLSWEIRSSQDVGVPNQAFAAVSLSALAPPGRDVLGASLLVTPDPVFLATASQTAEAAVYVTDVEGYIGFEDGFADFAAPIFGSSVILDVPVTAVGLSVYSQGLVLHTATLLGHHTNRVRTALLP